MAFPSIASAVSGSTTTNSATCVVDAPSGLSSGDIWLVALCNDSSPTIGTPSGWTRTLLMGSGSNPCKSYVFYRVCDGTEGSTQNFTLSGSEKYAWVSCRITGYDTGEVPEASAEATATSTTPDPATCTPSWGSADCLWIAVAGWDNNPVISSYPSGYTDNQYSESPATSTSCGIAFATKNATASSEDPGSFTISSSIYNVAGTIAIKGAAGGGTYTVTSCNVTAGGATGAAVAASTPPTYTVTNADLVAGGATGAAVASYDSGTYTVTNADLVAGGATGAAVAASTAPVFTVTQADLLAGGTTGSAVAASTAPTFTVTNADLVAGGAVGAAVAGVTNPTYTVTNADLVAGGASGSALAQFAGSINTATNADLTTGAATGSAVAASTVPVYTVTNADLTAPGAIGSAVAVSSAPTYTVTSADLVAGGATGTAAAASTAPVFTATQADLTVGAVRIVAYSGSSATRTAYADLTAAGASLTADGWSIGPGLTYARLRLSGATGSARARFVSRIVPWVANKTTQCAALKQTTGYASTRRSGRTDKPYIPDSGCEDELNRSGAVGAMALSGVTCTAIATAIGPGVSATMSATIGAITGQATASYQSTSVMATAARVVRPLRFAGGVTVGLATRTAATPIVSPAFSVVSSAHYNPQPVEVYSANLTVTGITGAAVASYDSGTFTVTAADFVCVRPRIITGVQTTRPRWNATATLRLGSPQNQLLAANDGSLLLANDAGDVLASEAGRAFGFHSLAIVNTASFIAQSAVGNVGGVTCSAVATFGKPTYTVTSADFTAPGATCTALAQRTVPSRHAHATPVTKPVSFAATGVNLPPTGNAGICIVALSGVTCSAVAASQPPQYRGNLAATVRNIRGASLAYFTAAGGGTTPLAQPSWLEWTENYPYVKPGIAYDATTYRTIFTESNVLIATSDAQLASHITTARTNSAIDAIHIDPAGGPYTFPLNAFQNVVRPTNRPLVVRTLPGASTQAVIAKSGGYGINQFRAVNGLALVDLRFLGDVRFTGGGRDLVVEACDMSGSQIDIQATRDPAEPEPKTPVVWMNNIHVRLNTCYGHFSSTGSLSHGLFTFGIQGQLIEGNIFDHNGWDPASTRSTPLGSGGPGPQSHNVYLTRPSYENHFRYNVSSRASSHGCHFKCAGWMRRNLYIRNPIGTQVIWPGDGMYGKFGYETGYVCQDNLFIGADDISQATPMGAAIWISNGTQGQTCIGNYAIDNGTSTANDAVFYLQQEHQVPVNGVPVDHIVYLGGNKSKNWPNGISLRGKTSPPPHPEPPVTIIQLYADSFDQASISPAAQALADAWNSDAACLAYVTSRVRLGVDINALKANMDAIRAGFA